MDTDGLAQVLAILSKRIEKLTQEIHELTITLTTGEEEDGRSSDA